jgi:hypothetical protein
VTKFERCPPDIVRLIDRIAEEFHPELLEASVSIDALFHFPRLDEKGQPVKGTGLKLHGHAAYAVARVVTTKDRAKGCRDVEIVIDQHSWESLAEEEREAVLDHELMHFELIVDDEQQVQLDDIDHPRVRIRKHDRQFGWFDAIARRRGRYSIEVKQALELAEGEAGQLYLPGIVAEKVVPIREPKKPKGKR